MDTIVDPLCYGDKIVVQGQGNKDMYISAESIMGDDINICRISDKFDNAVWEVYVGNQYTAAREFSRSLLEEFEHLVNIDEDDEEVKEFRQNPLSMQLQFMRGKVDNHVWDSLIQLERACRNEKSLNERLMALKLGRPVAFGEPVQLRHVKSDSFMTISSHELATYEKDSMKVSLTREGSSMSGLTISPVSRSDKEGHNINNNSEVLLKVVDRIGEFIHCSRKAILSEMVKSEINCSIESTVWVIGIYRRYSKSSEDISVGLPIAIIDRDSGVYLQVYRGEVEADKYKVVWKHNTISNTDFDKSVCSHILWVIEKEFVMEGGLVNIHVDRVILRDVNNGYFLKIEPDSVHVVQERGQASLLGIKLKNSSCEDDVLRVNEDIMFYDTYYDLFLCASTTFTTRTTSSPADSSDVVMYDAIGNKGDGTGGSGGSVFVDASLTASIGFGLHIGVEAHLTLRSFIKLCRAPISSIERTTQMNQQVKVVLSLLNCLSSFVKGRLDRETLSDADHSSLKFSLRQTMLREQYIIDSLLDILELCHHKVFDVLKAPDIGNNKRSPLQANFENLVSRAKGQNGSFLMTASNVHMRARTSSTDGSGKVKNTNDGNDSSSESESESESDEGEGDSNIDVSSAARKSQLMQRTMSFAGQSKETTKAKKNSKNKNFISNLLNKASKKLGLDTLLTRFSKNDAERSNTSNEIELDNYNTAVTVTSSLLQREKSTYMTSDLLKNRPSQPSRPSGPHSPTPHLALPSPIHSPSPRHKSFSVGESPSTVRRKSLDEKEGEGATVSGAVEEALARVNAVQSRLVITSSGKRSGLRKTSVLGDVAIVDSENDMRTYSTSQELGRMCLLLLRTLLLANHRNQYHAAIRLDSVIMHLKDQPLAVDCLDEIVSDNIQVLQTRIKQNHVDSIVYLLSQAKMNVTFLRLLQEFCVSPMGIDVTQRMVVTTLFSTPAVVDENVNPSIVITFSADEGNSFKPTFPNSSIFFPSSGGDKVRDVMGNGVVESGLPRVKISWSHDGDFSMSSTVRAVKGWISLVDFCEEIDNDILNAGKTPALSDVNKMPSRKIFNQGLTRRSTIGQGISKKQTLSASQRRMQIAEYLITQLHLVASTCVNRNYVAISILEKVYTYELLISILKSPVRSEIKAGACAIIRCLYVDRDPQVTAKYPRLVRPAATRNSIVGKDKDRNSHFLESHTGSPFTFAVLQSIISEYIKKDIQASRNDNLSGEILSLLYSLIKFGYYDTDEQLNDIIVPLIGALHTISNSNSSKSTMDGAGKKQQKAEASGNLFIDKVKALSATARKQSQVIPAKVDAAIASLDSRDSQVEYVMWEKRWLRFNDSIGGMFIILLVVIVTVIFALLRLLPSYDVSLDYFGNYFDSAISLFFATEYALRLYCFYRVNHQVKVFVTDKFNSLDLTLVMIDLVLFSLDTQQNFLATARVTRVFRIVRLMRLIRLVRAARLMRRIVEESKRKASWVLPIRYANIDERVASTFRSILQVLGSVNDRILDKNLDICTQAFMEWMDSGGESKPLEVYKAAMKRDGQKIPSIPTDVEDILLDLSMYNHLNLTQEVLQLLMLLTTRYEMWYNTAQNIQIINSSLLTQKSKSISLKLRQVLGMAEMFEIWSEVATEEEISKAHGMSMLLKEINNFLLKRIDSGTMETRLEYVIDEEIQLLIRNYDGLEMLISTADVLYDSGRSKGKPVVMDLLKNIHILLSNIIKSNSTNQHFAFKYLSIFIDRIDDGVASSTVVKVIIDGNRKLIKLTPRKYIFELSQKIITNGRKPEYLDMFLAMIEATNKNEWPVTQSIAQEISRYITNREWKDKLLHWFSPPDSPGYQERKEVMDRIAITANPLDVPMENLPASLQYHINMTRIVTGLNLGPKLQFVYPLEDLLSSIADPSTIVQVKLPQVRLFIEYIEHGSMPIYASALAWVIVEQFASKLESFQNELRDFSKWTIHHRIHIAEWLSMILNALSRFFASFDMQLFEDTIMDEELLFKVCTLRQYDILNIIKRIYYACRILMDSHSQVLDKQVSMACRETLINVVVHHDNLAYDPSQDGPVKKNGSHTMRKRNKATYIDPQSQHFRDKFHFFIREISYHVDDSRAIINLLEKVPFQGDRTSTSEVRYEPLVAKFIEHVRSRIKKSYNSRTVEKNTKNTIMWLLKALRSQLQKHVGFCFESDSIDMVMDMRVAEETPEAKNLRQIFNERGVTYLCLDLISPGVDTGLVIEAIKLLIILLLKSGGCLPVQEVILYYFKGSDSFLFFEQIKESMEALVYWCAKENETVFTKDVIEIPGEHIILFMVQLLCEGLHMSLKEFIRDQPKNSKHVKINHALTGLTDILSKNCNDDNIFLLIIALKTVHKLVQGPCTGNQEQFALETDLMVTINRIARHLRPLALQNNWTKLSEVLVQSVVDVLRALVDMQDTKSQVCERLMSSLELNILNMVLLNSKDESDFESILHGGGEELKLTRPQMDYIVFLKATRNGDNSMLNSLIDYKLKADVRTVEVLYEGEIIIQHFYVPEITPFINLESRDALLDEMDLGAHEVRLASFMKVCRMLFLEAKHQRTLSVVGINQLWHFKSYLLLLKFIVAAVMNLLLLVYYGTIVDGVEYVNALVSPSSDSHYTSYHDEVHLSIEARDAIDGLLILQVVLSCVSLLVLVVVKLPVMYQYQMEMGCSRLMALYLTFSDKIAIWEVVYTGCVITSLVYNKLFVTGLLLDFVSLDSTTGDVLYAIYSPFRQLMATLIIIVIFILIFATILFDRYRHDSHEFNIYGLWEAFKLSFSYGVRGEAGVSFELTKSIGERVIFDLMFYFVILAILRNIFYAIIVDTFGKLRELKFEKADQVKNQCFICGFVRHDFDRGVIGTKSHGFNYHRQVTHNIDNYIMFLMHLWEQSVNKDTSVESFIRNCLRDGETSWFPIGVTADQIANDEDTDEPRVDGTKKAAAVRRRGGGGGGDGGEGPGYDGSGSGGEGNKGIGHNTTKQRPAVGQGPIELASNDVNSKFTTIEKSLKRLTDSLSTKMLEQNNNSVIPMSPMSSHMSPIQEGRKGSDVREDSSDRVHQAMSKLNDGFTQLSNRITSIEESMQLSNKQVSLQIRENLSMLKDEMEQIHSAKHQELISSIEQSGKKAAGGSSSSAQQQAPTSTPPARMPPLSMSPSKKYIAVSSAIDDEGDESVRKAVLPKGPRVQHVQGLISSMLSNKKAGGASTNEQKTLDVDRDIE